MIFLKKKNTTESQDRRNCLSVRAIFVICTRVITSHSRYMREHSFSANQMNVIFHVHYFMKNQLVFKNFKFILISFQKNTLDWKELKDLVCLMSRTHRRWTFNSMIVLGTLLDLRDLRKNVTISSWKYPLLESDVLVLYFYFLNKETCQRWTEFISVGDLNKALVEEIENI